MTPLFYPQVLSQEKQKQTTTSTQMLIITVLVKAPDWKQLKRPSTGKWINGL